MGGSVEIHGDGDWSDSDWSGRVIRFGVYFEQGEGCYCPRAGEAPLAVWGTLGVGFGHVD